MARVRTGFSTHVKVNAGVRALNRDIVMAIAPDMDIVMVRARVEIGIAVN